MQINTKEIIKGIMTIDEKPVSAGMSILELENVLNEKIENREEHVGYVLRSRLIKDGVKSKLVAYFKENNVENLKILLSGFSNENDASKYLNNWLKNRGIIEWIGTDTFDNYYKTEFGVLTPSLISCGFNNYEITGFRRKRDLVHYSHWAIRQFNNNYDNLIKELEEMKIIEDEMTAE